ncbi:hypothetical protein [Cohnella panacarvi]|uniref:hypothetical protein n=1 Tax=Cohnella panacarvi TaxID=400776 RepID=UPI00047A4B59|nr:hypothetical protein [Cohnella panacarvi]
MSQIKIHVNDVRAENKAFKRMIGRVGDERDELSSLRRRLDSDITRRRSIDSRVSQAGSKLGDLQTRLQSLYNFIEQGMDAYIQADDKARDHPFEKKKKKSIWDKFGGAIKSAADGVTGFVEGVADAVIGTVEGIYNMIAHPIQTVQGLVYVVTHPVDVAVGIWTAVSESWNNDVVNGDAQSRGKWFGRMIGEVALAAVGTKGVDKIGKLAKGSKIVQEAAGVRIVPDALRGRVPGGNWKSGTPGKPEFERTTPLSPNKPDKGSFNSNNQTLDETIKKRVLDNIGKSKSARESSNYDIYLRNEKELLTAIEKKKAIEGTGEGLTRSGGHSTGSIDPVKFDRMKTAFEKQGGVIDQSDEAIRYLDYRGAEAVTWNEKTIQLRQNPTTSAVFEEFIHTAQYRAGKIPDQTPRTVLTVEIEATEKLINYRKAYGIPNVETRATIERLRRMRQELDELGK